MNNIFEVFFWVLIILIWVISTIAKKRKKGTAQEEEPEWFPFPKIPEEIPEPPVEEKEKEKQIYFEVKKKDERIEPEIAKITQPALKEEVKEEVIDLASLEKLEEGIILSLILGPPKAYQLYRR